MLRSDIGLIGLGVMGRNLSLNKSRGDTASLSTTENLDGTERFVLRQRQPAYFPCTVLKSWWHRYETSQDRAYDVSGPPVDSVIDQLFPSGGDILMMEALVMRDTDRRYDLVYGAGLRTWV